MIDNGALRLACTEAMEEENRPKQTVDGLLEQYELTSLLGSGSQGEVWRAINRATRSESAVKLLKSSDDAQNELRAYRLLSRAHAHPNLLPLMYSFSSRCVAECPRP